MFYVYVLKELDRQHFYTGSTNSLRQRLLDHKSGKVVATRGRQWKLYCYFALPNEHMIRSFEQYLKTGSGRAFMKKHFEFQIDEAR